LLEILKAAAANRFFSGLNLAKARRNDLAARKRYFTPAARVPPALRLTRSPRRERFRACLA